MENQEKFTSLNLTLEECKEKHICPVCGKECPPKPHSSVKNPQWKVFCSSDCRYSTIGLHIVNLKVEKTNMKRYGVKTTLCEKNTKEKIKNICLKKYGVENIMSSKEIRKKIKQTCLEKYGVENPFQSKEIKEKIKDTTVKKYGTDHYFKTDEFKNKSKETSLKRYGVENPSKSKEIKEKVRKTNLKKIGCEYMPQTELYKTSVRIKNYNRIMNKFEKLNLIPLFTKDEYISARKNSLLKFKCKMCGEEFDYKIDNGICAERIHCPNPIHKFSSKEEFEIYSWLKSLGIKNIEVRKRVWEGCDKIEEADLYLPYYNLVIEFNGIYWHSNKRRRNTYHYNKWKFFSEIGIDCIQIFENDWFNKKDVIKNIIKRRLNLCENNIDCNECKIKNVEECKYKEFANENSLNDNYKGDIISGLYYNNELVCCLSISKLKNKKCKWNIEDYIIKNNYNVNNGFEMLLNRFRSSYNGLISFYIDNRYYKIKEYENFGFNLLRHTKPNFYLFKANTFSILLILKHKLTKHKIKKLLNIYDERLSVKENIDNNNVL